MQSLESCTEWLLTEGEKEIRSCAARATALRQHFSEKYHFVGTDPLHLTIAADGTALSEALRRQGVECEYADSSYVVLLLSPAMHEGDFRHLYDALEVCMPLPSHPAPSLPPAPVRVCSMREAALSAWEAVPLSEAEGRVCGPVQVPCPPAVPLLVSGERIDSEWLSLMEFYGLKEIAVMV
jgi:hypothetical protein